MHESKSQNLFNLLVKLDLFYYVCKLIRCPFSKIKILFPVAKYLRVHY